MTDEDDDLSPDLGRGIPDPGHYAPGGPVSVVSAFMDAVMCDGLWDVAWALMDDNLKLCVAQAWTWANREVPGIAGHLDELVTAFVAGDTSNPWWKHFAEIELGELHRGWRSLYDRNLGAASHPRPIGPNLEAVLLTPLDDKVGGYVVSGGPTPVEGIMMLVRTDDDGLRIAGWSADGPPNPGWPPTFPPW